MNLVLTQASRGFFFAGVSAFTRPFFVPLCCRHTGSGASSGTYEGYLDYVLTPNLCVGGPDGRLNDNVNVESDECRTKYKVKYLSGPAPAPTPSPGGQSCGNVCFKDSDCLTSGGFGCTRCSSYDTGAHGTCY